MLSLWRLDYRSLAALRICLGLVLIFDLFTFLPIADFYLSDQGFVSRTDFLQLEANPWNWSLLFASGDKSFVYGFLAWHFITLVLFVIGYKTRLQTFLLWVQIVSLHNRNWIVLNGGDDIVRCCLILLIFLPLGRAFSVDSKKHVSADKMDNQITCNSFFNFALYLQLSIMYFASAVFKDHPFWNKDFSALHYVLNLDLFIRPLGVWLKSQDHLIAPLTAGAYYFELLGPALIFIGLIKKFWNHSRYLLVISFIGFHLTIDALLNVGTFPYFTMALWLAFLPSHFWNNFSISNKFHQLVLASKIKFYSLQHNLKVILNKFKPLYKITFNLIALFFIFNLLYWPLKDNDFKINVGQKYYPDFFQTTNRWLATYQNWHLFAPYPKIDNLWMEVSGTLDNGKIVDLYRMKIKEEAISANEVREYYGFEKWRKILLKVENSKLHQSLLATYFCKNWNEIGLDKFNNRQLINVTITAHNQLTPARGLASKQRKENILTSYSCLKQTK